MSVLGELWPKCAVCRRPVERMERNMRMMSAEIELIAHCHGQMEVSVLAEEALQRLLGIGVGRAFENEALDSRPGSLAISSDAQPLLRPLVGS